MDNKHVKIKEILNVFNPMSQLPLDFRQWAYTENELKNAAKTRAVFRFYPGLIVTAADTGKVYIWKEWDQVNESGLLENGYTYPNNYENHGYNYSGKTFNFVEISTLSNGGGTEETSIIYPIGYYGVDGSKSIMTAAYGSGVVTLSFSPFVVSMFVADIKSSSDITDIRLGMMMPYHVDSGEALIYTSSFNFNITPSSYIVPQEGIIYMKFDAFNVDFSTTETSGHIMESIIILVNYMYPGAFTVFA